MPKYRSKILEYTAIIDGMPVPEFTHTGFHMVRVKDKVGDKKVYRVLLKKDTSREG